MYFKIAPEFANDRVVFQGLVARLVRVRTLDELDGELDLGRLDVDVPDDGNHFFDDFGNVGDDDLVFRASGRGTRPKLLA